MACSSWFNRGISIVTVPFETNWMQIDVCTHDSPGLDLKKDSGDLQVDSFIEVNQWQEAPPLSKTTPGARPHTSFHFIYIHARSLGAKSCQSWPWNRQSILGEEVGLIQEIWCDLECLKKIIGNVWLEPHGCFFHTFLKQKWCEWERKTAWIVANGRDLYFLPNLRFFSNFCL